MVCHGPHRPHLLMVNISETLLHSQFGVFFVCLSLLNSENSTGSRESVKISFNLLEADIFIFGISEINFQIT